VPVSRVLSNWSIVVVTLRTGTVLVLAQLKEGKNYHTTPTCLQYVLVNIMQPLWKKHLLMKTAKIKKFSF